MERQRRGIKREAGNGVGQRDGNEIKGTETMGAKREREEDTYTHRHPMDEPAIQRRELQAHIADLGAYVDCSL